MVGVEDGLIIGLGCGMEAGCSAAFGAVGERAGGAKVGTDRPKSTFLICRRLYHYTISDTFEAYALKDKLTELHANVVACALLDLNDQLVTSLHLYVFYLLCSIVQRT